MADLRNAQEGLTTSQKLSMTGDAMSGIGSVVGGINALSSAKVNARIAQRAGKMKFQNIMGDVKQAVGSFTAGQGASGVISNSAMDVRSAGMSKGIKDAVLARYNSDIEAANMKYEGKMGLAEGIMGAGQSLLSMGKTASK